MVKAFCCAALVERKESAPLASRTTSFPFAILPQYNDQCFDLEHVDMTSVISWTVSQVLSSLDYDRALVTQRTSLVTQRASQTVFVN